MFAVYPEKVYFSQFEGQRRILRALDVSPPVGHGKMWYDMNRKPALPVIYSAGALMLSLYAAVH